MRLFEAAAQQRPSQSDATPLRLQNDGAVEQEEMLSLCVLHVDDRSFGIDTHRIGKVLGCVPVQRVPLAPAFVAGVLPYRGEVLTTVSLRALLGYPPLPHCGCVVVLDDAEGECFGLEVDGVGGVTGVLRRDLAPNPSTLGERAAALFCGGFRLPEGLLVHLQPERLSPASLLSAGLFTQAAGTKERELPCEP